MTAFYSFRSPVSFRFPFLDTPQRRLDILRPQLRLGLLVSPLYLCICHRLKYTFNCFSIHFSPQARPSCASSFPTTAVSIPQGGRPLRVQSQNTIEDAAPMAPERCQTRRASEIFVLRPFATVGYDLAVDMRQLRKAVVRDESTFTFKRDTSREACWDGVVASYGEAVSRQKVSRPYLSTKLS